MNTPIYDALVAELRDQHRATVPFRRPAPAGTARPASAPAPRTYDWFAPTPAAAPTPAPKRPEPMAPLGLQDIARLLAAHDRQPAAITGSAA